MSDNNIISCQIHDHVEIACLYGYQVELVMNDNSRLQGQAKTTQTGADKKEWLLLNQGNQVTRVELKQIKRMIALTDNPHFGVIDF